MKSTLQIVMAPAAFRRLECPPMLLALNPNRLSAASLQAACGNVDIRVAGALPTSGPRFAHPKVRRFHRHLHQQWPYAPFFCAPDSAFLEVHLLSHLEHLRVIDPDQGGHCIVEKNVDELLRLLLDWSRCIGVLGTQAQMSLDAVVQHHQEFLRHALHKNPKLP